MLKNISKIAEKVARNNNTASEVWLIFHQPQKPKSLIKKD